MVVIGVYQDHLLATQKLSDEHDKVRNMFNETQLLTTKSRLQAYHDCFDSMYKICVKFDAFNELYQKAEKNIDATRISNVLSHLEWNLKGCKFEAKKLQEIKVKKTKEDIQRYKAFAKKLFFHSTTTTLPMAIALNCTKLAEELMKDFKTLAQNPSFSLLEVVFFNFSREMAATINLHFFTFRLKSIKQIFPALFEATALSRTELSAKIILSLGGTDFCALDFLAEKYFDFSKTNNRFYAHFFAKKHSPIVPEKFEIHLFAINIIVGFHQKTKKQFTNLLLESTPLPKELCALIYDYTGENCYDSFYADRFIYAYKTLADSEMNSGVAPCLAL